MTQSRGFFVHILDGPAVGWGYLTAIPPDQTILVAPLPGWKGHGFFREATDTDIHWPGAARYVREELPFGTLTDDQVTDDGDIIVGYKLLVP